MTLIPLINQKQITIQIMYSLKQKSHENTQPDSNLFQLKKHSSH